MLPFWLGTPNLTAPKFANNGYKNCEAPGNNTADQLAKVAAVPGKTHPFAPLLSREKVFIRQGIYIQRGKEWNESRTGNYVI